MQSHTGCICLTLLHCVFSNVPWRCLSWRAYFHTGCIFDFSLLCIIKFASNRLFCVSNFSHVNDLLGMTPLQFVILSLDRVTAFQKEPKYFATKVSQQNSVCCGSFLSKKTLTFQGPPVPRSLDICHPELGYILFATLPPWNKCFKREIACLRGCKIKLFTFVWLFSAVFFYMFPQMAFSNRFKVTQIALIWFFSAVYFQISLQTTCLRKCILTLHYG